MGVGTLAAVAVVITSLVWLVGCCVYCCCRRRRSREEGGVTVANRDLMFLDIGPTEPVHNGTMSSGYNTGPQPYTTSNSYNNPMARNGSTAMLHTSLDSVISVDQIKTHYYHYTQHHNNIIHFSFCYNIMYNIIITTCQFCYFLCYRITGCTAFLLHVNFYNNT